MACQPPVVIDYYNPCYDGGEPCTSDACFSAYASFGGAAMARYAGRGIVWETINEANGMGRTTAAAIARMARDVRAAAGSAAAGELFVGPTTAGVDLPYINASFAAGLLASVQSHLGVISQTGAKLSQQIDLLVEHRQCFT